MHVQIMNRLVVSKNEECPHWASPHSVCNNVYLVKAIKKVKIKILVHLSVVQHMLGDFSNV